MDFPIVAQETGEAQMWGLIFAGLALALTALPIGAAIIWFMATLKTEVRHNGDGIAQCRDNIGKCWSSIDDLTKGIGRHSHDCDAHRQRLDDRVERVEATLMQPPTIGE